MDKIFYILLLVLSFSCNEVHENHDLQGYGSDTLDNKSSISEVSISESNNTSVSNNEILNVEGKTLISPKALFDILPSKYSGFKLEKISSGKSNSKLGKFTTCTGIYRKQNKSVKIRLSDYFDIEYFPDLHYYTDIPVSSKTFSFEKVNLGPDFIGYVQWHKAEAYGIIEILVYNRYNINIEIDNFPDLKENYKSLIENFDLKKLNEINRK